MSDQEANLDPDVLAHERTAVLDNIASIRDQMLEAAQDARRSMGDVTLVAVSKVQPDHRIDAALEAGLRVFGENRVQEAQARWAHRREQHDDLRLHLVGPLQTNKVKDAVALFDVVESVDRPKLATKLAEEMAKQGRKLDCYVQVNTGAEEQKAGVLPGDDLVALHKLCVEELGLNVVGLMCIPPIDEPAAMHFGLLADWAKRLDLSNLSMGMSDDFELAIRMGATSIRVGSALFGARTPRS
ncbi:MAG: YggS family pyridoxal phosphate-dependent enzyme [Alphaproteobacteria bacterium]|nr:YggS family pyridoxal phosphate-dependent enzyme [Alphaproteobacteria bacterium SS10]